MKKLTIEQIERIIFTMCNGQHVKHYDMLKICISLMKMVGSYYRYDELVEIGKRYIIN